MTAEENDCGLTSPTQLPTWPLVASTASPLESLYTEPLATAQASLGTELVLVWFHDASCGTGRVQLHRARVPSPGDPDPGRPSRVRARLGLAGWHFRRRPLRRSPLRWRRRTARTAVTGGADGMATTWPARDRWSAGRRAKTPTPMTASSAAYRASFLLARAGGFLQPGQVRACLPQHHRQNPLAIPARPVSRHCSRASTGPSSGA